MAIQIKKNNNGSKSIHKLDERSLNNKNKKSKSEKSKLFSKLTQYSKNVLNSAKNLSIEVIGAYIPNAKDIADDIKSNVQESLENVKKSAEPIVSYAKKSLENVDDGSIGEKIKSSTKKTKDDILQRLKTGKFYKSEDELASEGSDELFDDFGFDDDGFSFDDSDDGTYVSYDGEDTLSDEPFTGVSHGSSIVTNVTAKNRSKHKIKKSKHSSAKNDKGSRGIGEYRLGDEMVSSSIIDIGNALLNQNENLWARNFAATEQRTATIVSYENHILTGVNALVEYNNNVMSEVARSTIEFHEKSLAASQDTIDLLRELKDTLLITSTYKQEEVQKTEMLNGMNLGKDYYKNIKNNIEYVLEDYGLGGVGDMLSMAGDALEMSGELGMKFDPISALIKMGAKSFISNSNKGKMKLLNDRLENFGSTFIGKMNELSKYGNGFGRTIGNLLGVKEKPIRKINNMGVKDVNAVVGWTSRSDRTLNEVIPTYLRKILSATSGQEEILYDYSSGRFTSSEGIKKEIAEKQRLASTNETIEQYNLRIASLGSNSLFSTDEFKKKMMNAVKSGEVNSEEEYREKVAKNAKKNIDGIVNACVRTGIPFNAARASLNDFNNDYANSLVEELDGSKQEKRTALIMLCESFNKMTRKEQESFNSGILRAFTETQNKYNALQSEMMEKGYGSLYTEVSLDDEIKELQRSLTRDKSLNMDGTYVRGNGGKLQLKRMENARDRLMELQALEYTRGSKSESVAVGNFNIDNNGGAGSIPGTINNIFKLLVEGIPVYNIPITDGLPSHLKELRKAINVKKEDKVDFKEEDKLNELIGNISEAKHKEKNRIYFGGDSIGSALLDRFRDNKFNRGVGKITDATIALYDMLLGQAGEHGSGIFGEDSIASQEKERKKSQLKTVDETKAKIKESDWNKFLSDKNKNGKMTPEQIARLKKKFDNEYDFDEKHKNISKILNSLRNGLENDIEEFDENMDINQYSRENGGFAFLSDFADRNINSYRNLENAYGKNRKNYKSKGSYYYGQKGNYRVRKGNSNKSGLSEQYDKMYRNRCAKIVEIVNESLKNPRLKNVPKASIRKRCGNDELLKITFEQAFKQNIIQNFLDGNRDNKSKNALIRNLKSILLTEIKTLESSREASVNANADVEETPSNLDVPKFASGGIVPEIKGISPFGDKVITRQNPGEMNLNKKQQKNLFDFIKGLGGKQKTDPITKSVVSNEKLSNVINGSTDEKSIKAANKHGVGAGIFTLLSQMNHTMASTLKLLGGNDKGELDEKNKETIAGQLSGISSGEGSGKKSSKDDDKNGWFTPELAMILAQGFGIAASSKGITKRFKHEGVVSGVGSLTGLEDEANSMYNADGTRKSNVQVLGDRITRETRRGIIMGGERQLIKRAKDGLMKNPVFAAVGKRMIENTKRLTTAFSKGGAKGGFKAIARMTKQGAKESIEAVVKSFKENIINFFTNNKILSKLNISKDLAKKLGSEVGEKVAKNVAKEATEAAGKKTLTGALKAVPVAGWVFAIVDVLYQISEGYNLAGRYFGVGPNEVTKTMRTVSMIVKGLKALVTNLLSITGLGIAIATGIEIILPDKWLVNLVYNLVASKEEKEARAEAQVRQQDLASKLGVSAEGLSEAQNKSTFEKMTTGIQTLGSKMFGEGKSYDQISKEKTLKKINKQRVANGEKELSYDEFTSIDNTKYKSIIIDKIRGLKGNSPLSEFNVVKENFDKVLSNGDTDAVKSIIKAAKERDGDIPPLTKDMGTLTPSFREKWEKLLNDPEIINAKIKPYITGARRPLATQLALYTKGRSDLNTLDVAAKTAGFSQGKDYWADQNSQVTWTLKSKHLGGNALDIDTRNLSKDQLNLLGKKAKEYGIEWGGFWKNNMKDEPHFEDSKPVQSFSRGGIVAGKRDNLYGDKVKARLNPKEMVLNETQQAGLFNLIKSAERKLSASRENVFATFKNPFVKDTEMTNDMISKALAIQTKIYEEQKRHNSVAEKFFEALMKMIATSMNMVKPNIDVNSKSQIEETISDSLIAGAKAIAAGL